MLTWRLVDLSLYDNSDFDRGASRVKEGIWMLVRWIFFQTSFPWPSAFRVTLLRLFGARVGHRVVIRSDVNISFAWRVNVVYHVCIGDDVGVVSLDRVSIV